MAVEPTELTPRRLAVPKPAGETDPARRLARRAWAQLWRKKVSLVGVALTLAAIVAGGFAPWLAPVDPNRQDLSQALTAPSWMDGGKPDRLLGNDNLGRDLLSRTIHGARVSLFVGFVSVLISCGVGTALGLLAGYYGGRTDALIMRLADVQMAFPFILLQLVVVSVVGAGMWKLIAVLGITGWVIYGRVVRAQVLSLREMEFVQAARAIGNRDLIVIARHVLPNVAASLIVIATLEIPRVIITESALTFLGLGIQPPQVSWGQMLADARNFITTHWWLAVVPGVAIQLTVLGLNLAGDWLRDVLDPRLQP